MKSTGRWHEGNRERIKFRCPLKTGKKKAAAYNNACPANHPSFNTGACYGCTKYLDVTDDARARVPRDSREFKETFHDRQSIEQYFARLGDREVEQTTHYSLKSVRNQMSIAHMCQSLVAVTAAILLKQPEKMRCYRTFAQPPKKRMTGWCVHSWRWTINFSKSSDMGISDTLSIKRLFSLEHLKTYTHAVKISGRNSNSSLVCSDHC